MEKAIVVVAVVAAIGWAFIKSKVDKNIIEAAERIADAFQDLVVLTMPDYQEE